MVTARIPQSSLPPHAVPVGGTQRTRGEQVGEQEQGASGRESLDLGKKGVVERDSQILKV